MLHSDRNSEEVLSACVESNIPCAPINSVDQVFEDEQVLHRELLAEIPHPTLGTVKTSGVPLHLHPNKARIYRPPPLLGEHTSEVLRECGFTPEHVRSLLEQGAARQWEGETPSEAAE